MATVTSFEGLRHPRKSELRQFAELFEPLFLSSSDEARRQAAAALSQCPHVPPAVAHLIGSAPISIAAIFLTRAPAIDEATLVSIIRSRSAAHGTAIARRDDLSAVVVDALVERRQTAPPQAHNTYREAARPLPATNTAAYDTRGDARAASPAQAPAEAARVLREEALRRDLKALALKARQPASGGTVAIEPVVVPEIDILNEALLVRFARSGEANLFTACLAAALDATRPLGERILLDISGQQLALTLCVLGVNRADMLFILQALYPDLTERLGGATRADVIVDSVDPVAGRARLESWLRADRDDRAEAVHNPHLAPDRGPDPRQTSLRPVSAPQSQTVRKLRGSTR